MSSNRKVKQKLIERYGNECFIDKLNLRTDKNRKYTGKAQMQRMKQLSYHHIVPKSKGGNATVENGALLSVENHVWFHKQIPKAQRKMNEIFQKYKHSIDCQVEFVDYLDLSVEVATMIIEPKDFDKLIYNRAKEKEKAKKIIKEERENK